MPGATRTLRIGLAQLNTTVGDVDGNALRIGEWIVRAHRMDAQLVVFPELALSGYPAEDLWLKSHFLDAVERALRELAAEVDQIVALVGFPERRGAVHNSLAVISEGRIQATYRKMLLPNYGVFDERRYFEPGSGAAMIEVGGLRVGLTICEDIWFPDPPASTEALAGAALIVNASASPYHRAKGIARERMVAERARETGAAFALCNAVGGQDELVFDGHSVVASQGGETLARAAQFDEELLVCNLDLRVRSAGGSEASGLDVLPTGAGAPIIATFEARPPETPVETRVAEPLEPVAEVYAALVAGLGDYVAKNRFERVLVAVSGGIDSALVALIAADALGGERVTAVVMPSPHSSDETQADARAIASNLGAELVELPIEPAMRAYERILDRDRGTAAGSGEDVAAENIQARIRGNLIMALSNRSGWLVLTTGNKSELSVGYATLYGDMAGGFAVLKDVPKTLVYELVRDRSAREGRELVPPSVLERAPSAELRPGQRDEDSLPPYELLDRVLEAYVESDRSRAALVADGIPADVVDEVVAMVDRAEYKRRQAAPGIKITPRAFGRDRRLPITNRFRG